MGMGPGRSVDNVVGQYVLVDIEYEGGQSQGRPHHKNFIELDDGQSLEVGCCRHIAAQCPPLAMMSFHPASSSRLTSPAHS
jgi:hypothetical protein